MENLFKIECFNTSLFLSTTSNNRPHDIMTFNHKSETNHIFSNLSETGFFLIAWLHIKGKTFTMEFMDRNSAVYKTNAKQVKHEMTSMLNHDEGFLSSDIRRFR